MTFAGACGETEREFGRAAHFSLAQADLHPALGELIGRMNRLQHGSRLTLVTANAVWRQQGYPFTNTFLELARTRYHADAEAADFAHAAGAASSRINAWIERRTRGRIKTMLDAGRLDSGTRLVLCNALYFKGNWRSQFKVKETQPAPFYLSTTQTVSVPMMRQSGKFKMARIEEPAASLLELPYYGGDLAMVIILPDALDGLAEVESALTAETLNAWLARLDKADAYETYVHLPRFTTRRSLDLIPLLRSLGGKFRVWRRGGFLRHGWNDEFVPLRRAPTNLCRGERSGNRSGSRDDGRGENQEHGGSLQRGSSVPVPDPRPRQRQHSVPGPAGRSGVVRGSERTTIGCRASYCW